MIALIINPPIKEIMGVIIMDPTPKSKPNTPKLKGLVVEEGTLANIAPNSTAQKMPTKSPIMAEIHAYIRANDITGID